MRSKSQLGWLNLPYLAILPPLMTTKQRVTKKWLRSPQSTQWLYDLSWLNVRRSEKILDEVSRINQKTVADECDDVTTQSGRLVQLTPALTVWKSNVRSEAKASLLRFPAHQVSWVSEWVSDWVRDFSPWASSATEGVTKTKFGTEVA